MKVLVTLIFTFLLVGCEKEIARYGVVDSSPSHDIHMLAKAEDQILEEMVGETITLHGLNSRGMLERFSSRTDQCLLWKLTDKSMDLERRIEIMVLANDIPKDQISSRFPSIEFSDELLNYNDETALPESLCDVCNTDKPETCVASSHMADVSGKVVAYWSGDKEVVFVIKPRGIVYREYEQ